MKKLGQAIIDVKVCRAELMEKSQLIDEKLIRIDEQTTPSIWRDPTFIVSGVAISFGLGSVITYAAMKRR